MLQDVIRSNQATATKKIVNSKKNSKANTIGEEEVMAVNDDDKCCRSGCRGRGR